MFENLALWVACALFAGWLLLSIAAQFSEMVRARASLLNSLGLVPAWNFFAPQPGVHDTHLLHRDRLCSGHLGDLRWVPALQTRRWWHAVWYPSKYRNKAIADLADSLAVELSTVLKKGLDPRVIMLSTPYLVLLSLVMESPGHPDAAARQFIIARNRPFGCDPERMVIFTSEFHSMDRSFPVVSDVDQRGTGVRAL